MDDKEYKHYHSYLLWNTKKEFEIHGRPFDGTQLYEMIEYAFMFCKCGVVKKLKVEDIDR
jgi:hypothetical protein